MGTKSFKKDNPNEILEKSTLQSINLVGQVKPIELTENDNQDINSIEHQRVERKITMEKKVGRPKTKDVKNTCKNINVAVPITLLDKWEEIKIVYGNNLTAYITKLIERDMDINYEQYKKITNSLKSI